MRARTLLALTGILLAGCASARGGEQGATACQPVTGTLAAAASLTPLAGRFIITMVATAGPRSGQTVAGYLTLRPAPRGTPAPSAGARTAFVGVTDVGLEIVGALRLGDTGAQDSTAPGVAVYEQRAAAGAPTVTARIGSATTFVNPQLRQIEGDYTVLYVRQVGSSGFAGGWQSAPGGTTGREARGHFCAVRVRD